MATTQSVEESTRFALEQAISSMEMIGVAMGSAGTDPQLITVTAECAAMLKDLLLVAGDGADAAKLAVKAAELSERTSAVAEALAGNKEKRKVTSEVLTLALKAVGVEKATWPSELDEMIRQAGVDGLRTRNLINELLKARGYGEDRIKTLTELWRKPEGKAMARALFQSAIDIAGRPQVAAGGLR